MEAWAPQAAASPSRRRWALEPSEREWAESVVRGRTVAESVEAEPRAAEESARELALGARALEWEAAAEPPSLGGRVPAQAPSRLALAAPAADSAWLAQQAWVAARAACFASALAPPPPSALAQAVVRPKAGQD